MAAGGERRKGRCSLALIACVAIGGVALFAPTSEAGDLTPGPDPNPIASQVDPQPDPYQSAATSSVVQGTVDASHAATKPPRAHSTPAPTLSSVLAAGHASQAATAEPSRRTPTRPVVHRPKPTNPAQSRLAESLLEPRWTGGFAPPSVVSTPRNVPAGVALAVAAVVLLSAAFLAVVARQAAREVVG